MSTALLDLTAGPSGVAEVHAALDRLQQQPADFIRPALEVAEVERAIRRLEAYKLKLVASADKSGAPADAGFAGTEAWVAKTTTVSRTRAAREVALARNCSPGTTPRPQHSTTGSCPRRTRR